jgi:hypothetical protein
VPFHFSAKASVFSELFVYSPTAMHAVDEVHDTPHNRLYLLPVGAGGSWSDHVVPFHFSAKGTFCPELFVSKPTAVHAVDEVHETPTNSLPLLPVGAGGSWSDHVVPFHFSAKGTFCPELFV